MRIPPEAHNGFKAIQALLEKQNPGIKITMPQAVRAAAILAAEILDPDRLPRRLAEMMDARTTEIAREWIEFLTGESLEVERAPDGRSFTLKARGKALKVADNRADLDRALQNITVQ